MIYSNYKCLAVLVGILLATFSAHAKENPEDWRLLIEPSFSYPPIVWPIVGAKQTVIVPARMVNGIPWYLTPEEKSHSGLSRQQIEEIALKNASQTLAKLKPQFIRNGDGVILYAVLKSDQLVTASTVLAPDFAKLFENTIGPDFLIVIPNRFRIYIFPRLFAPMAKIAEDVAIDFRSTAYPVSKEIFTLHKGVLSCIGILER
jgi:hypothetical protein